VLAETPGGAHLVTVLGPSDEAFKRNANVKVDHTLGYTFSNEPFVFAKSIKYEAMPEHARVLREYLHDRTGPQEAGCITAGSLIYIARHGFRTAESATRHANTASYAGEDGILTTRGRHDPCVVPRAVPIVEAMAALVIIDAVLAQDGRVASSAQLPPGPVRALPPSMRRADDPQAEAEKAAHQAGEKVVDAQ
ncbi:unnamed protein product, partial [Tilletia caries]